jgi:hypothetical protein
LGDKLAGIIGDSRGGDGVAKKKAKGAHGPSASLGVGKQRRLTEASKAAG